MRKLQTYGSVKDGILKISKRDLFNDNLKQFPDCRVTVTVEKLYKKRSTRTYNEETGKEGTGQNGYYHYIICEMFRDGWQELTGQLIRKAQAHEYLKFYCNYREDLNEKTGEILHVPLTTSDLTTVQFEDYCQRCREWVFENMGIDIPKPNEQSELDFKPV